MCPADTSAWCLICLTGDAGKSWVAATVFGVNIWHVVAKPCVRTGWSVERKTAEAHIATKSK